MHNAEMTGEDLRLRSLSSQISFLLPDIWTEFFLNFFCHMDSGSRISWLAFIQHDGMFGTFETTVG